MPKRENALSHELQQEVNAVLLRSFRPFATVADAQAFINAPERKRRREISQAQARIIGKKWLYATTTNEPTPDHKGWVSFYERFFPAELASAGGPDVIHAVPIPEQKGDFERVLIVIPGISMNRVYDECAEHFTCWRYTEDLDKNVPVNDRSAVGGAYAIRLRARVEADEEHKNNSANDLAASGVKGITLLERMLLELKHFEETGGHLDIQNVTLCSGSRDADGGVPYAGWRDGEFGVNWDEPSSQYPFLRVREVLC